MANIKPGSKPGPPVAPRLITSVLSAFKSNMAVRQEAGVREILTPSGKVCIVWCGEMVGYCEYAFVPPKFCISIVFNFSWELS